MPRICNEPVSLLSRHWRRIFINDSRRRLLGSMHLLLPGLMAQAPTKAPARGLAIEATRMKKFVAPAHSDLERTTAMFVTQPALGWW